MTNKMKLLNVISFAAVVGVSLIATHPSQAQRAPNGWEVFRRMTSEHVLYIKRLGCNGNYCMLLKRVTALPILKSEADCLGWRSRYINDDNTTEEWEDVMPGTTEDSLLKIICN